MEYFSLFPSGRFLGMPIYMYIYIIYTYMWNTCKFKWAWVICQTSRICFWRFWNRETFTPLTKGVRRTPNNCGSVKKRVNSPINVSFFNIPAILPHIFQRKTMSVAERSTHSQYTPLKFDMTTPKLAMLEKRYDLARQFPGCVSSTLHRLEFIPERCL